ncbi:Transcription elongation factor SPT5 [Psilocybe cubensis]|uniref:Transcription elongation factor SPT5 n=2 Tax=Psilocybe cubensis TaxID=181762 RepID=A0ACB8GHM6_PSICU|nr:Transcription elongation factor SPT5 [Psilocybe cubensis]KAH9474560.1 Transcription elongation factor SPT5 [Psilocybe cubensis]
MSDEEDQHMFRNEEEDEDGHAEEDENVEDDDEVMDDSRKKNKSSRRHQEEDDEEEDDEEEEDEDDEEEEEEEEEMHGRKGKKRAKHRHKRSALSRFLDIEAEVSEEEEEEEEDEEYGADTFITNEHDVDDDVTRRTNALLDSSRHFEEEDSRSPEEIAKAVARRHRDRAAPYTGDMNEIPQRLLMPSVHDASLWQVRVKPGRERDIVFSLMRKAIDVEYTARPLSIVSAFQRDSLPGMIYVEARSSKQVQEACNGLVGVYPSRGIQLVPIEEMASLLQIKKQEATLDIGAWVRIRRGKYAGDLAQVMDQTDTGEDVGVRLIPRIDMNPRDDMSIDPQGKKRKKTATGPGSMRPPQRLFNYEEILKVYGRKNVTKRNQAFVFQNDTYKDGFLEKDFKANALITEDVNPTLDEITQFTRRQDGGDDNPVNLSAIAEASRKAAISVLQPGDHVEVFEGEQSGVHGVVDEIHGEIVTITAQGLDLEGQKMEIAARSVRKRFKPGDHVKVMAGQNADETGLVVSVSENVVTFVSDMSMQEISVFSKDLREAAEVGSGSNVVGNYELYDLVQLDAQTVGVIFKTERDSFRVLDQHGQVRLVQPHQISMRRDSHRAIATDSEGHELRVNDNVKEVDGEGRKGRVLHTHQSFFAFLHNRDIAENSGVFVTRTRSLASLAPKSNVLKTAGADLSKMNPAMVAPTGGMVGSGNMGRGPRDRDIGATVTVIKGPHKGYVGTIKDTNGPIARVELRTGNKIIMIEKTKIYRRYPDGRLEPLDKAPRNTGFATPALPGPGMGGYGGQPMNNGGRTPYNSGKTPNPYSGDSRTPAWNASSRTPNPYSDSRTPAWNASSRTPNPYADGGRTPAWNVSSRTPNPYATGANAGATSGAGWGGATPGRNVGGWQTPGRATQAPAWNAPAPQNEGWGSPSRGVASAPTPWDSWSAPTPGAAPTPGLHAGPTPAYATPAPHIQTPAAGGWSADAHNVATPGVMPNVFELTNPDEDLDGEWMFEPELVNYIGRVKVIVDSKQGRSNYSEYNGRRGRITTAQKVPTAFQQTVLVRFMDRPGQSEEVSLPSSCVVPVQPSYSNEEVLVLGGKRIGNALVIREKPEPGDKKVVVSSKETPLNIDNVPMNLVGAMYEEGSF